jgi:hypothetical protein
MATLTIEIPDELMAQLIPVHDQLPELLSRCLSPSVLSTQAYRHIIDFLTSQPTPAQIAAFRPTLAMQQRLQYLLDQSQVGNLATTESQELEEYEQIEHLIVLLKSGNLPYLSHPTTQEIAAIASIRKQL